MQGSFAAKDLQIETLHTISQVIGAAETHELLQSLVASLETAMADMALARGSGNYPALARAAHRLAGGCGSLGALHLQQVLQGLEKAALAGAGAICDAEMARLPMLAAKLRSAVDTYAAADALAG